MTITLTFYDEIRTGDAERVLGKLSAYPGEPVEMRINSPGGDLHEGLALFNALKPRKPTVYIDGVAASCASLIAMAGAKIIAAENALIMIHDPWTSLSGNAGDFRKNAELLDKHRDASLVAYARTGITRDRLTEMLAAETWLNAEEALALGFVDEIAEPLRYAAHSPACFAGYRNTPKELTMPDDNTQGAPVAPSTPSHKAQGADVQATTIDALRQRNEAIMVMGESFKGNPGVQDLLIKALADPAYTAERFGQRVLMLLGQDAEPLANYRGDSAVPASGDDFIAAASDCLAIRAGVRIEKPHPGVRDVRGMGMQEIMRACVSRSGSSRDLAGGQRSLVKAALTTSDFPSILENSLSKILRAGYEEEPSTFEAWTRFVTVPDFKPQSRPILGSAPELLQVLEGAEYTYGSLDEDKAVPYQARKFGRLVQLTWEALVNDDLAAFTRMTQALGQAASRSEADFIYDTFGENSGSGPEMQDGTTLFHASHGNLAASAAAVDADALGAARILLRRQTAIGGGAMNLPPRFLLVAPEHEQDAETLLAAAARSLSQGSDNALVPAWLAKLELVVEARLADSAIYLLTGPGSVDTFERAWLEEDNGPVISEKDGFETDNKTYKVRHVFGGRWLDWRGAVKVPIA
ncbi:head maturation protease, ClpP-related [Luteimonas soli]|uniref:ATP-dependent Clp protease proteolytic subunit n=1 Tax=Luteimonas soli TaxID=1648966 RepID=A0ABV7XJR0_9GAMM